MSCLRILVSGISGGIGAAFVARARSHPDWEVIGLARAPNGHAITFDAAWPNDRIAAAIEAIDGADALVCLHGADIVSPPLRQASYLDRLEALYRVDLAGTVKLIRAVLPKMKRGGVILVMGWDQAGTGMAGESAELYALTKGALTSYAKSLAATLEGQALVYVVAPGWVLTRWGETLSSESRKRLAGRTRSGRWQTPDQVAQVLESLLIRPGDYASGEVVYVDRGADVTG